jgi:FKBP-type peptidyl-prolyl cis-trans isomerase SlyD
MEIADKKYVAIEYTLTLESGQEIDKSPAGQPLGFITGAGQIIPGLEKGLMGRAAGDPVSGRC